MAKIDEAELKAQIKNRQFSNVYFIYGEESYLKEHYVNKLTSAVVDPAFADFNYHRYDGKDISISDILQDAETVPMMAEYSFILVRDYPFDKSANDCKEIKEFLKDVPDTCVLVFWYDSLAVDTKKNDKFKSLITAFAKAGSVAELNKRTEGDIARLIVASAKKRGCTIDSKNARYLISVVGSDLKTVFNETEKLCFYIGEGEIKKEHIDEIAVKSLQARVYDLSKFILAGNSDGAYGVLNALFANKEEPVGILAVLSSCYIDMYRAKCAKSAGESESDIAKYFNYKGREFLISNAARNCRNISTESLRESIDTLSKTDEMLKSTSVDGKILLEETVAKLFMLRNG